MCGLVFGRFCRLGRSAGARSALGAAVRGDGGPARGSRRFSPTRRPAGPHHKVAAARAQLDEAVWKTAWAEGKAMTLEEAVEYALEGDRL